MPVTGLEEFVQELAAAVLETAAVALLDAMREAAPYKTGELVESAYGPNIADLTATIGFDAPQADWTNQGTEPHFIEAVNAQALYFFWENGPRGADHYSFQSVSHPGIDAGYEKLHWFDDLVDQWQTFVDTAAEEYVSNGR